MNRLLVADFKALVHAQDVEVEDYAFICPMCRTVQSARDLIRAGAGADFEAVRQYVGFSCVGRWTNAGSPRAEPDGKPCNWTLGGLFTTHKLEVIDDSGKYHPHFEVATPEQAKAHALEGGAA